jgi:hypothetical protein
MLMIINDDLKIMWKEEGVVHSKVLSQHRTFLRARAQIVDKFRKNSFSKPWEFRAAKWSLGDFHRNY